MIRSIRINTRKFLSLENSKIYKQTIFNVLKLMEKGRVNGKENET